MQGAQAFPKRTKQPAALTTLLGTQSPGSHEVVRPSQRAEEGGEGRGIVEVTLAGQHPEDCGREAVSRTAEPDRTLTGRLLDGLLGPRQLRIDFLFRVAVQPGLVTERVVPDLMASRTDCLQGSLVLVQDGVLT